MMSEGDQWTRTQVHGNGFCTSVDYSAGLEIQRSRVQFPAGGLGVAFYATGWVSKCLFFRHSNLLHLILTFTYQIPLPEPLLIVKSWGNCKMARTNRQLLTGTASNKGTLLCSPFGLCLVPQTCFTKTTSNMTTAPITIPIINEI